MAEAILVNRTRFTSSQMCIRDSVSAPAPESAAGPAALLGLYEVAGSDGAALPGAVRDGGDHQQRAGDIFRPLHYPAGPLSLIHF